MVTIVNTGFLLLLLQILNYILSENNGHTPLVTTLLIIAAIGSTLSGGLLLLTQITFKGVIACNSMINTGFLLLGYGAVFNLDLELNQIQLTHYILHYIIIYNISLFVLFNCW
jgi:formate hydrogenlyase subunit 3/multisubunit Na+/H+ antiporter MnhD subunit